MGTHRLVALGALVLGLSSCSGDFWAPVRGGESLTPLGPAATPNLSVGSGIYDTPQKVTVATDTPGAVIYYTTDGDDPTTSSRVYGGPVLITSSLTLKALAIAKDYAGSHVATATYSFDSKYEPSSGLPTPRKNGVPRPEGKPGGLKVVDWAGFKAAITYTFDDSGASQVAAYPQLQATGERMTFFLTRAWAEHSPIWAQAAADGHEIGNHTHHHCLGNGTGCGSGNWSGSIEAEYDECTDHIKKVVGAENVWTTAAPYGDTRYDSVAPDRFFLNRGTQMGHVRPNGDTNPYRLPAFAPKANSSASALNAYVDTARAKGHWQIYEFHSLKANEGYMPVDISELISSIDYTKSWEDVWIDSMVNVGAYWAGQKALSHAIETFTPEGVVVTWTLPSRFPTGKYLRVTLTGGTLKQGDRVVPWNEAGYYEISLDPGALTISR